MSFTDPYLKSKATSVPGKGVKQAHVTESAQDDPGSFLGGVSDMVPGKTVREDDCLTQGQDAGSHQAKVPSGGKLNVGASGEGKSAVDGTSPEIRSTKAPIQGHGNTEMSVHPGSLFPGVHD